MHPFSIQHNALLRHGAEEGSWAWPLQRLASQLQRIEVILAVVQPQLMQSFLEALCQEQAEFMQIVSNAVTKQPVVMPRYTPDLRMPVLRSNESWVSKHFAANYKGRARVPDDAAAILSYNLRCKQDELAQQAAGTEAFENAPRLARQRWRCRVVRQLLAYWPDIICLQHVEGELTSSFCSRSEGKHVPVQVRRGTQLLNEIIKRLEEEDFDWCAAPGAVTWANAVFWKRSKWCLESWETRAQGNMRVSLLPPMATTNTVPLIVGNIAAECAEDFEENLESMQAMLAPFEPGPSVLCGATGMETSDARDLLKGLQHFRSAHKEVLGHELPWTEVVDDKLRCSDEVWIREPLTSVAVLDGHKPYRDVNGQICRQTMPTDHLLSVVVVQTRREAQDSVDYMGDLCMQ